MPRSGSELLQVILHQNPKIYGSATSPLLEYQFGMRANYELPEVKSQDPKIMFNAFQSSCRAVAQGYYEAVTDRPIVIDKNRGWSHYYEWVDQWNPNPKMICMVRDLRSIIASMERIFRKNRHNPTGPDNPAKLQNMTVDQRVNHWLNTQPVGLALQRTADCFQRGIDEKILFVRYEDLTSNPEKELKRVYSFIEEEYYSHYFDNLNKTVFEDDSHFGIFGSHKIAKTLTPSKPRDWSDVLPIEIATNIRKSFPWYFENFQYV